MSIDHKAWLFDYNAFEQEFASILFRALESGDTGPVKAFISQHHAALTNQWTEAPFGPLWEEELRRHPGKELEAYDVQDYADIALTRYYDCTDARGLAHGWDALVAYMRSIPDLTLFAEALVCGYTFGPERWPFDPGRMGTGFVPPDQVEVLHGVLEETRFPPPPGPGDEVYARCHYKPASTEDVTTALRELRALYREAAAADCGLLFADFHD
jgi:hypothetical protein